MTSSPLDPSAAPATSERRATDRKPLRIAAIVHLAGGHRFDVRTLNISPGGMAILASANPRPGTRFELEFALPVRPKGQIPVKVQAQVAHSIYSADEQGFKIGIMFADLTPESAQAIIQFLK